MLVMLCIPQYTPYRPGPDAEEKSAAQKQPDEADPQVPPVKFHGNQKARGNGRMANNGGFKKRAQWVYKASDWDPFYDLENDAGPFAYLCILVL
jgi:hypothetical protein